MSMLTQRVLTRRAFVLGASGAVLASGCRKAAIPGESAPFELIEADLRSMQIAMSSGALTSRRLCEAYLARIASLNPTLHAIIETNPDTLAIADELDRERRNGKVRGALHGIPILVKDTIETADKMQTAAGALAMVDIPVTADAFVVERLRNGGAVILGKANLNEWSGITGQEPGWSSRGGLTKNPYDAERSTLGSSSGSAVAVAASLCGAALGGETIGSIVAPSSVVDVVGMKPTVGLVSRRGTMPVAPSADTIGPIARTVRDAAVVLTVIAAPDPGDSVTTIGRPPAIDYSAALDGGLRGVRLGVVRDAHLKGELGELFDRALDDLRQLGATLVEVPPIDVITPEFEKMFEQWAMGGLAQAYEAYFRDRRPNATLHSLADVLDANTKLVTSELTAAKLGQETFQLALKASQDAGAMRKAREFIQKLAAEKGIGVVSRRHGVDALLSGLGPAYKPRELPVPFGAPISACISGTPIVSVPMGRASGLPTGLWLFGPAWSDDKLLRYAYAYEQRTHHRKPPG